MIRPVRTIVVSIIGAALAVLIVSACTSATPEASTPDASVADLEPTTPAPGDDLATVDYVIDGDTVDIVIGGVEERVRLIGIDTPEKEGGFRDPECFGDEATAYVRTLLPEGTMVRLERDAEARDDFGRLLAYIYRVDDGLFVNLHLVAAGYADTLRIPPNTTFSGDFAAAAVAAEEAGLGLWSACGAPDVPIEP